MVMRNAPGRFRPPFGSISRAAILPSKGTSTNEYSLTSRIKNLSTYQDLINLFDSQANESFNHIHTSSLLSGLAKTFPQPSHTRARPSKDMMRGTTARERHGEAQAAFMRVLRHASKPSVVSKMGPRELATVLWASAKVLGGETLPPLPSPSLSSTWLGPLLGQLLRVIPRFKPQDISMCLWSLATLTQGSVHVGNGGFDPILMARVMESLMQAAGEKMTSFGAQSVSNSLWALSKLGKKPSDGWMRAAECRLVALMHELTPQALANTSWSLVQLEHSPSEAWASSFLTNTRMALFESPSSPSSLLSPSAVVVWSIARLGIKVDDSWMDRLSHSVYSALSASSHALTSNSILPLDLANILWAMATLGYRPKAQVVSSMLSHCILQINAMGPNELCSLLWSIAKMRYVPSGSEWRKLSDAIALSCPSCSSQGLCNIVWSVAALRLSPGKEWMREILSTLRLKMDDCGPQELANLWWALGTMQWPLDADMKDDFAEELNTRIDDFNAGETAMILWALVRLSLRPTTQALVRHLEVISGANHLREGPVDERREEERLSPRTIATLLWSLSQLDGEGAFISSSFSLGNPLYYAPGGNQQEGGRRKMWGLKIRSLIHKLLSLTSQSHNTKERSDTMRPRDIALSLYSLSRLKVIPPTPWLVEAMEALATASPSLSPQQSMGSKAAFVPKTASIMSLTDASMSAFGLSSLFRLHNSCIAAKAKAERRRLAASGPLLCLHGGTVKNEKEYGVSRVPQSGTLSVALLVPSELKQRCVDRIALCGALGQESIAPGRQKDISVVTLLASLPSLVSSEGGRRRSRYLSAKRQGLSSSFDHTRQMKGALVTCLPQINSLIASAQLSIRGSSSRPSHLSTTRREVTSLLSSLARMGLQGDPQFVSNALSHFLTCQSNEERASEKVKGSRRITAVRDWIVCLWSLERILSHDLILNQGSSLVMRRWLKAACHVILSELSRPMDGRPEHGLRGNPLGGDEWKMSKPRRLASPDELQSASASALRLHKSILEVAERGVVDPELQGLGESLKKVSGRLKQVHWRRVYIGKASRFMAQIAERRRIKS